MHRYYHLTKPGIVYGNTLTAVGAYLFGLHVFHLPFDFIPFCALVLGLGAAMGSACVFNNVIDANIDARMERTKDREIPAGTIRPSHALVFGFILGLAGLGILYAFVSPLAFLITLGGVIVYVAVYTPAKRVTPRSTLIGAVAGAVPPVAGYAAAVGLLDARALVLFLILVTWQMTHFFAIGLHRSDDYRAAGLPVLPLVVSASATRFLMVVYAVAFSVAAYALYALGGLGLGYAIVMTAVCGAWIALGIRGFFVPDIRPWARRMFFVSLVVLLAFSFAIAVL